ncbi:MAG: substrate-binding periplasmic protein [Lachnospirales bacterium]|jgi:ABC-type amino acid transport substrate-binding protein
MKNDKIITLALAALMTVSLPTACSSKAAPENSAEAEPQSRLETVLNAGKITNVCEPYFAPFEFIDNTKSGQEQFRGADMELARYIAQELGVELEIVPMEWSAVLTGVASGKYDMAVAGMAYTPERAETMAMSDIYKPGGEQGLLVAADKIDEYTSLESFAGAKVAFQSGTLQEQNVLTQLPDAEPVTFDIVQNAVLALASGKVDAVSVSVDNGNMFSAANPSVAVAAARFDISKNGNAIGFPKGETELVDAVNKIIAKVKEQGLYDQWLAEAVSDAEQLGIK